MARLARRAAIPSVCQMLIFYYDGRGGLGAAAAVNAAVEKFLLKAATGQRGEALA
jgi:hypothetical protein